MRHYFSHDEGARNDPKLIKVLMKLGQEGKGVYWDLIEMLYEQNGHLELTEVESFAWLLRTSEKVITSLISDFGLFENNGETFWSNSVLYRLELRNGKKTARAEAGSKGGKIRAEREAAAKARGTHTKEEWTELLEICNNECVCCGSKENIQKDHIVPIYQGSSDSIANLQPLCKSCNTSKGAVSIDHRDKYFKQISSKNQALLDKIQAIKEKEIKVNKSKGKEKGKEGSSGAKAPVEVFHSECKDVFLTFYESKAGTKYYFDGAKNALALNRIIQKVRYKVKEKNPGKPEADLEPLIVPCFKVYIEKSHALNDKFLKDHFNLSMLDSSFNDLYPRISNTAVPQARTLQH